MSAKKAADYCEAIEAEFAWFAQVCNATPVETVIVDGDEFAVCAVHVRASVQS